MKQYKMLLNRRFDRAEVQNKHDKIWLVQDLKRPGEKAVHFLLIARINSLLDTRTEREADRTDSLSEHVHTARQQFLITGRLKAARG